MTSTQTSKKYTVCSYDENQTVFDVAIIGFWRLPFRVKKLLEPAEVTHIRIFKGSVFK